MIMDSVEDLNLIHDIWPKASHGAVLVTSRNPALSIGPAAGGLEIEAFPDPEGSEIIMGVVARPRSSIEEREAAQRLSARLGGLALTLVVMASQIRLRGMTISRFLDFYEIYTGRLQKSQPGMGVASKQSLERSWDSIFDYLRDSSPDAAKILGVVAFMAPDWIPKRLFTQDQMPDDLEFCKDEWRCVPSSSDMVALLTCASRFRFGGALLQLTSTGLLRQSLSGNMLYADRLTQDAYRNYMGTDRCQDQWRTTSMLLCGTFPKLVNGISMRPHWTVCKLYISHVMSLCIRCRDLQPTGAVKYESSPFLELATSCGWCVCLLRSYTDVD